MKQLFNDDKVVQQKKLQDDLQEHLQDQGLDKVKIARAKKIARNGRDSVITDSGAVMDPIYNI